MTAVDGAGPRALAAVQAAAAVLHGRLAAGAAGPRLRPAARRRQVVARRVAVLEPAPARRCGGGAGRAGGGTTSGIARRAAGGGPLIAATATAAVEGAVVEAPVDDDPLLHGVDIGAQLGQGEGALLVAGHQAGGDGGEADGVAADPATLGVDGGRGVAEIMVGHGAEAHHQPVAGGQLVAHEGADEVFALGIGEGAGEIADAGLLGQVVGAGEG